MKKRTSVKRTVTKLVLVPFSYDAPDEELDYSSISEKDIRWLRTRVQEYAGRHRIDEDLVLLSFEQVEASEEEMLARHNAPGGDEL
jgi:hypothetical protein